MRRLAAVLVLALIAAPAFAGKTVIVMRGRSPSAVAVSAAAAEGHVRRFGMYRTLGMDFHVKQTQTIKTEWMRTLVFPGPGGTGTQSYVAGIVQEFSTSTAGELSTSPCAPCSLTTLDRWADGPWVLFTADVLVGTQVLANTTSPHACTTGFANNPAPQVSKNEVSHFVPGTDFHWRSYNNSGRFTRLPGDPPAPGVWRVLTRESRNGWNPYAQQGIASPDWDSLPPGAQTSDTVGSVARYRKNGAGPPLVFATQGAAALSLPTYGLTLQALALADSAAGYAMLGQTSPLPVRFNIQIGPFGASGDFDTQASDGDAGVYPGDSAFVKARLANFALMGIKLTALIQTNPDSVAAHASQLEWIRIITPLAKVSPFDKAGVWNTATTGNATATKVYDAMGAERHRSLFPAGCADPRTGCASECASDTASVFCWITKQFAFLERYYGKDRVDRVIACPKEDFSPKYFTRTRGSLDSLKWCLWLAGVRGVRVGNMELGNDIGTGPGGTNPRGYSSSLGVQEVRDPASGALLGHIVFMPGRDWDSVANVALTVHDLPTEFLDGLLTGDWYTGSRSAQYTNLHNFFVRPVILEVPTNALGGNGTALGNWGQGYWNVRSLWGMCSAVNRFGRKIIEPSWGEETAEWVLRSGVR